jgi:hypothetical protein
MARCQTLDVGRRDSLRKKRERTFVRRTGKKSSCPASQEQVQALCFRLSLPFGTMPLFIGKMTRRDVHGNECSA